MLQLYILLHENNVLVGKRKSLLNRAPVGLLSHVTTAGQQTASSQSDPTSCRSFGTNDNTAQGVASNVVHC